MSDPRITPFNGRVAHVSLKGKVDAERFVEGEMMQVDVNVTALNRAPTGPMDRELLYGQAFLVLDAVSDDFVYGISKRDAYCGWINRSALRPFRPPTHRVAVRETLVCEKTDIKAPQERTSLFFGSEVCVDEENDGWSRINLAGKTGYLPSLCLALVDRPEGRPVDVARLFRGVPYVWGGNSGRGIDCSGLIQASYLACGVACPGDSDLQMNMNGRVLNDEECLQAGDLLFWRGHVAMATGPTAMTHATAHCMAVVEERTETAIERIAATDTGPVTLRLRPSLQRG